MDSQALRYDPQRNITSGHFHRSSSPLRNLPTSAMDTTEPIVPNERAERLDAYRLKADPIIALIGSFYLVLLLIPHAVITSWDSSAVITLLDVIFWSIITADVAWRTWLSPSHRQRLSFVLVLMLLLTGPFVFLSIAPEARLLIRVALISVISLRALRSVRYFFRLRSIIYIVAAVALTVIVSGVVVTSVERDAPRANITSLGIGLWWAVVTISTVGYGDTYPITTVGRVFASALMFFGVAMFGILTATLASSFAKREAEGPKGEFTALYERLERIEQHQLAMRPTRRTRTPRRPRRRTASPRIGSGPTSEKE